MPGSAERRRRVLKHLVDHRVRTELVVAATLAAVAGLAWILVGTSRVTDALPQDLRASAYQALAGVVGALLGFVLAALAVLIALPTGERLRELESTTEWDRVPGGFMTSARALLLSVVLVIVALLVDSCPGPRWWIELPLLALLAVSLVRVVAALALLDALIAVVLAERRAPPRIEDP
jgi:hypothetical protein